MNIRNSAATSALAAVMFACAGGALAQSDVSQREFTQRLVGRTPVKAVATTCFARVYDAAHLAAHPKQKVTQMGVVVRADTREADSSVVYSFVMGVRKRGDRDMLNGSGSCGAQRAQGVEGPISHIGCGIDCDGGGVAIEPGKTAGGILVRIQDFVALSRPEPAGKPEEEPGERVSVQAGEDDRVFRLERVAIEQCRKLFDNQEAYDDFVAPK